MTKEEWYKRRAQLVQRMQGAAEATGKDSPLYRVMGELAWGRLWAGDRYTGETKDNIVLGYGFGLGVCSAAIEMFRILGTQEPHALIEVLPYTEDEA